MEKAQVGLIGLAVMGQNLVLNMENHGYRVAVYNRTTQKVDEFLAGKGRGRRIIGTRSPKEFVAALEKPRKIVLMVQAGPPVDQMIRQLIPHLSSNDIIIDGGNSFYRDTRRRYESLRKVWIRFIGSGVSGGEEGALKGPSLMPGGSREAYEEIKPIWESVAAKVNGEACTTYLGPDGAGHFVKMVHNGIEYGDMQLIAEAYDILRTALDLSASEMADIFDEWNQGVLRSYLIEITANIFRKLDPDTGRPLVDLILDSAGQKGTGKWTSQVALDLGVPTPTINAAVEARILSSYKEERLVGARKLKGPRLRYRGGRQELLDAVQGALFASKICSYAQGMALLKAASEEYKWELDLSECARIWRGGCIIRAQFLDDIREAFMKRRRLTNLMLDTGFKDLLRRNQRKWRFTVRLAAKLGIPVLAMGASLGYYDSFRRAGLPQNLTQAQRDYFGAHTYRRIDKPGVFHTEWNEPDET